MILPAVTPIAAPDPCVNFTVSVRTNRIVCEPSLFSKIYVSPSFIVKDKAGKYYVVAYTADGRRILVPVLIEDEPARRKE